MEVFSMVTKFGLVTVLIRILQSIEESKGALWTVGFSWGCLELHCKC